MPLITVANSVAFLNSTALNPVVTGVIYWLIRHYNKSYSLDLQELASSSFCIKSLTGTILLNPKTLCVFKSLFFVGLIKYFNSWLNHFALNNFTNLTERFVPGKEIAVVTGGSGGIGGLTVKGLSQAGLKKVIILDIQSPTFETPDNVIFYKTDLTSGKEIDAVAEKIRKEIGHPTIVINNAGTGIGKTILGSTERSIKLTFNVNAVAPFLVTKAFLPNMIKKNHGHVVTIASLASFTTPAQMVDYCASKAAALAFSEGLSQELRNRYGALGVRNTVVHPMWVKTPLTHVFNNLDHFLSNQLEPEQVSDAVVKQVLSGRSAQLCIPESLGFSAILRALPNWLQEKMRDDMQDMIVVNKDF